MLDSIDEAIRRTGLRDGMTISFHHNLRNGDRVLNMVMERISRQGIRDLPAQGTSRFEEARQAERGGYIVKNCEGTPDIILVGSGSEVSTLYEGASRLEKEKT